MRFASVKPLEKFQMTRLNASLHTSVIARSLPLDGTCPWPIVWKQTPMFFQMAGHPENNCLHAAVHLTKSYRSILHFSLEADSALRNGKALMWISGAKIDDFVDPVRAGSIGSWPFYALASSCCQLCVALWNRRPNILRFDRNLIMRGRLFVRFM